MIELEAADFIGINSPRTFLIISPEEVEHTSFDKGRVKNVTTGTDVATYDVVLVDNEPNQCYVVVPGGVFSDADNLYSVYVEHYTDDAYPHITNAIFVLAKEHGTF